MLCASCAAYRIVGFAPAVLRAAVSMAAKRGGADHPWWVMFRGAKEPTPHHLLGLRLICS